MRRPSADSPPALAQAAAQTVTHSGQSGPREQILAGMIWDYVIDGQVTLGCGDIVKPSPRDWITTAKWLFAHVDGQPPRGKRRAETADSLENDGEEEAAETRVEADEPEEQTPDDDEPYAPTRRFNTSVDTGDDEEDEDDEADSCAVRTSSVASDGIDYELRAQQIEAARHGTPIPPRTVEKLPPSRPTAPPPTYAYGSTPVTSLQPDGSVRLIDRAEYEHRRQQGFRNGTRHRITQRRDDG